MYSLLFISLKEKHNGKPLNDCERLIRQILEGIGRLDIVGVFGRLWTCLGISWRPLFVLSIYENAKKKHFTKIASLHTRGQKNIYSYILVAPTFKLIKKKMSGW